MALGFHPDMNGATVQTNDSHPDYSCGEPRLRLFLRVDPVQTSDEGFGSTAPTYQNTIPRKRLQSSNPVASFAWSALT